MSIRGKVGIRIETTKKSRIAAAIVTLLLAVFLWTQADVFFRPGVVMGKLQLVWAVLAALAAGLLLLMRFQFTGRRKTLWQNISVAVLSGFMPVATLCMMEFLHGTFIYNWSPAVFIENYMFILIFAWLLFALFGRICAVWIAVNSVCYLFGLLNHFVVEFRGVPFLPMDIVSAKTGLSVAGGYQYLPDNQLVLSTALFVLLIAVSLQMRWRKPRKRMILAARLGGVFVALFFSVLLYQTDWFADHGMKPDFFNQTRGYTNRGSLFQFVINTKYMRVEEPKAYDATEVGKMVKDTFTDDIPVSGTVEKIPDQLPNVICIMNETLADLSVLGPLETNEEYLPYLQSLEENTIRGYVHVPVFGSGTANSEFEFLTGDSLAFLPAGSCAYESYIKAPQPSLVSVFDQLGYYKTAFHPYYGDNWDRELVYPLLGFDRFADISTILGEDIVEEYRTDKNFAKYYHAVQERYPEQTVFLRRYISDIFNYEKLIEMYEQNEMEEDQPFFMFNVTMQNHSGYQYHYSNFDQEIHLTGKMEGKYPKVDQFLSLIYRTDTALKELIEYYSAVDEPTVLCVFGDHLPSVETAFYEEMYGKDLDDLTLEEEQKMYMTPFFIWANYDIEEATVEHSSLNYLSSLLMETAGLPKTHYQRYLTQLHEILPVITAVGYMDCNENWYRIEDKDSPYDDLIENYRKIQYNHLFDREHRAEELYLLDGARIEV